VATIPTHVSPYSPHKPTTPPPQPLAHRRPRLGQVIEIMRFRLGQGTTEEEFLAADHRLAEEFASHQPGLLRRTTARGEDGDWIVIDLWRSAADADACDRRWDTDPVAQAFMALLDHSTVTSERYHPLD
jgi:hypothetical protein